MARFQISFSVLQLAPLDETLLKTTLRKSRANAAKKVSEARASARAGIRKRPSLTVGLLIRYDPGLLPSRDHISDVLIPQHAIEVRQVTAHNRVKLFAQ